MSTATLDPQTEENQQIWASFEYHSRTFSLAARFLPREVQLPVASLYLFCRRVDSIADQRVLEIGAEEALREVRTLENRLHATLEGHPPDDDVLWPRLADVDRRYGLKREPFEELIEGAVWDLEGRPVRTRDDLIEYSNLVGGSVGAMMLPFLSETDRQEELETSARKLGIAMQITNILRDVGEDLDRLDRIYVPSSWMNAKGVSREMLANGRCPPEYKELLERVMETAEELYRSSEEGIAALPFRIRFAIRSAARMYREIMNEVRANEYDNLNHRAYVSFRRKLLVMAVDLYNWRKSRTRH